MFAYINKKIAMPDRATQLKCVAWNAEDGYVVCGGSDGVLKVLKLDDQKRKGSGSLEMNQSLEGHNDSLCNVRWNEKHQKLTSTDAQGLIIVWQLHKGLWFEEMVNNRNKSVVTDLKWTHDGRKICIVYADGAVIVGSVDGNREWGRELVDVRLTNVEWSPNNKSLLFGTDIGEVHSYVFSFDSTTRQPNYTFVGKCPILSQVRGDSKMVGIEWNAYSSRVNPNAPSLAICFNNGRVQLMLHQFDEDPILIDSGLKVTAIAWNKSGTVFSIAGTKSMSNSPASTSAKLLELHQVQCYNSYGKHMCSVKVPGNGITGISWEKNGTRLCLSVDNALLFAKVKSNYNWTYFSNTFVYAFQHPDRPDMCVGFWDPVVDTLYFKYVKDLLHLKSGGEHCIFVTKSHKEDLGITTAPYCIILCNSMGTALNSKFIDIEPTYITMTSTHIIACSAEYIYIWQYIKSKENNTYNNKFASESPEYLFHVDQAPTLLSQKKTSLMGHNNNNNNQHQLQDIICSVTASNDTLIIGRSSGTLIRYSLPKVQFQYKYTVRCRPKQLALNCNSHRLSIIDINGLLTLFDLYSTPKSTTITTPKSSTTPSTTTSLGEHLSFVRKDVWNLKWSDDNPLLLACMEKTKMYIIRDLSLEEPVLSNYHIAEFSDLVIKSIDLDNLLQKPQNPNRDYIIEFHTKSLRDTELLLETCPIEEAVNFVKDNSHQRLWKLIAEHALEQLNFELAENAFVNIKDYSGVQLIKRLKLLPDRQRQKAEVAVYFRRFDHAEQMFLEMGEPGLAVDMRVRLGDWLRVEKLILQYDTGNDKMLQKAYQSIGDYFADRLKWQRAYNYYDRCNYLQGMIHCAYMLDDYDSMRQIINVLPNGSHLLNDLGKKFLSVGLCEESVASFEKADNIKAAIDACVELNQWDLAVEKSKKHHMPGIDNFLEKSTNSLLENNRIFEAIELYRKANKHASAAKHLMSLARKASLNENEPIPVKQFYVLSAIEIGNFRKVAFENQRENDDIQSTMKTVDSLLNTDGGDVLGIHDSLDNPWHGAEAYHFWILAQKQLLLRDYFSAMIASLRLRDYEDILSDINIYSLIALSAFHAGFFGQASRAFMKLEMSADPTSKESIQYQHLALVMFSKRSSKDPNIEQYSCPSPNCDGILNQWDSSCDICQRKFSVCVASGKTIWKSSHNTLTCNRCKHEMYANELRSAMMSHCPLCHNDDLI